jgi:hypothetical protein
VEFLNHEANGQQSILEARNNCCGPLLFSLRPL